MYKAFAIICLIGSISLSLLLVVAVLDRGISVLVYGDFLIFTCINIVGYALTTLFFWLTRKKTKTKAQLYTHTSPNKNTPREIIPRFFYFNGIVFETGCCPGKLSLRSSLSSSLISKSNAHRFSCTLSGLHDLNRVVTWS